MGWDVQREGKHGGQNDEVGPPALFERSLSVCLSFVFLGSASASVSVSISILLSALIISFI